MSILSSGSKSKLTNMCICHRHVGATTNYRSHNAWGAHHAIARLLSFTVTSVVFVLERFEAGSAVLQPVLLQRGKGKGTY